MSASRSRYTILYDASSQQLVSAVVDRVMASVLHAWRENRTAHVVLTGGRTGVAICKALDVALFRATSQSGLGGEAPLKLSLWFSDERFVLVEDEDRSDSALIAAFELTGSRIDFKRVISPAQGDLEQAAAHYAAALDGTLGEGRLDAVLLSMGEDGHIASLFPGHEAQLDSTLSAVAVDNSPKPPSQRVSIGVARLARSSAVYIFAVGEGKREALNALLDAESPTEATPISMLRESSPATQITVATDLRV